MEQYNRFIGDEDLLEKEPPSGGTLDPEPPMRRLPNDQPPVLVLLMRFNHIGGWHVIGPFKTAREMMQAENKIRLKMNAEQTKVTLIPLTTISVGEVLAD